MPACVPAEVIVGERDGSPEAVCGANQRCLPQPNGDPVCTGPTGAGEQYTYCTASNQCDSIHECVPTGPNYSWCLQWCTADADCPNYYDQCWGFSPQVFVGGQEWGVCYNGVS